MDLFRRVIGSLGGDGRGGVAPDFPYEVCEKLASFEATGGVWDLHTGRALRNAPLPPTPGLSKPESVTVHVANVRGSPERLQIARATVRRLRTLRHPSVLRYIASTETADATGAVSTVYLATEHVVPLNVFLREEDGACTQAQALLISHDVLSALHFLHADANLAHGALWDDRRCFLITRAGEARLAGFEASWGRGERPPICSNQAPTDICAEMKHAISTEDVMAAQRADVRCAAMILRPILERAGALTPQLAAALDHATGADAQMRSTLGTLLDAVTRASCTLGKADLVGLCARLDTLPVIADDAGRATALSGLASKRTDVLAALPRSFARYRVLSSLESLFGVFSSAITPDAACLYASTLSWVCSESSTAAHDSALRHGRDTNADSCDSKLDHAHELGEGTVATLSMLFARQDRGVRAALLECISGSVYTRLSTRVVQESVFPRIAAGFADGAPMLRDMTLKASLHLAPRLTARQLHGELARAYARLQTDSEPGVRVNAAVCFARVASLLARPDAPANDPGVLALRGAIAHALRDPFDAARRAGLGVVGACEALLPSAEIAMFTLPAVCPLLVDAAQDVRAAALRTVRALVARVEHSIADVRKDSSTNVASETAACASSSTESVSQSIPQKNPPTAVASPTSPSAPGATQTTYAQFAHEAENVQNPWSDKEASISENTASVRPLVLGSRSRLARQH